MGGGGLTKLTNGKLVFLHRSLFACLAVCVAYLSSVCGDVDVEHYCLYNAAN